MVVEREWRSFFDANSSSSNTAIRECPSSNFCRALIFLPDANFRGELQLFPHSPFLKCRNDNDRISGPWKHQRKEALAHSPANARKVIKRSPGRDEQRVIFWRQLAH